MSGWIKLHRRLLGWEWYDDHNTLRLFTHFLLTCNYEPETWRGKPIGVGQRIIGRKKLASESGLSEQQIRTCLRNLQSTNDITIKSTKEYSLITVVNWIEYQESNQQPNQQTTSQTTTPKEVKKERKKNITPIVPLPDWLNEKAWQDLLSYRGNKFTYRAKELSIMKLDKLRANGNKPEDVINQTIMNGYKGLFAVKKDYHEKTKPSTAKPSEKQRTVNAYADIITKRNAEANKGLSGEPEPTDDPSGTVLSDTKGLW